MRGWGTRQLKGEALAEKQRQNEAFGSLLQDLRKRRKWNKAQLAIECELDRSTIRLLELGLRSPSLNTLLRIADAFGLSFVHLASLIEHKLEESNAPTD